MNAALKVLDRPYAEARRLSRQTEPATQAANDAGDWQSIHVDVVIGARERTLASALAGLTGAVGVGLALSVAILLLGLPVALTARGIIEAVGWLFR